MLSARHMQCTWIDNSLTIMLKKDRLSWKPTISLLFNFMTNVMIHDHKTSPDLKWNSPTFPWPWRNFCPWPFPALWQPCLTFKMFCGKNLCQGNSDQCYNVHVDLLFKLPLLWLLENYREKIENNSEMKSHLGPKKSFSEYSVAIWNINYRQN